MVYDPNLKIDPDLMSKIFSLINELKKENDPRHEELSSLFFKFSDPYTPAEERPSLNQSLNNVFEYVEETYPKLYGKFIKNNSDLTF